MDFVGRRQTQSADGLHGLQTRPDGEFHAVLVPVRIAEVNKTAVAHILGDKATKLHHDFGNVPVKSPDELSYILRV